MVSSKYDIPKSWNAPVLNELTPGAPLTKVVSTGFHLFCHVLDGLGIIAELVACLKERADNVTYTARDSVFALLHRLVTETKNIHQLAGKLRNGKQFGHLKLAPSQVTLGQAFGEFDAEKLKALNERLMKRSLRNRKGKGFCGFL